MDITREEIGTLNEVIKLKLSPEDYNNQFESEIKKYQRSANMPGFRPGHVPAGLIKKRYGRSILVEELNKIVSGTLQNFITEHKLDLLGSPIPTPNGDAGNNWDEPGDFEFSFEIGLAPEFELTLPPKNSFDYFEIKVDDKRVETYLDDIRRKYGKFSNPEVSDEHSILYGELKELENDGSIKEGGITSQTALSIELIDSDAQKKQFVGLKKEDTVSFAPHKAFGKNPDELAHMLNVEKDELKNIKSDFQFVVNTVNHIEKAELNQELFDKLYGAGNVTSEEQLRERIKSDIAAMFAKESDHKLKHDIDDNFIHELKISLPDEFLRKWLQTAIEKPLSPEQVEKEYPAYARSMKLRMVENKIFKDQELQITDEEIREKAKEYLLAQFQGYGSALTEDILTGLIARYLEKRESVDRIIESLSEQKVFNYLKTVVKTKKKEVTYDEFVKIVQDHQHEHHH